jgi:hypothetical protein
VPVENWTALIAAERPDSHLLKISELVAAERADSHLLKTSESMVVSLIAARDEGAELQSILGSGLASTVGERTASAGSYVTLSGLLNKVRGLP